MEIQTSTENEYFIPHNKNQLFIKFFRPIDSNNDISICFLIVHWMDNRGHKGNRLYNKLGNYYASQKGIPVFLFDIQGTGSSHGKFEFLDKQKNQVNTVYEHIISRLQIEFTHSKPFTIIPIVHSISIVPIMSAINEGLPIKQLIWIGGPPSHAKSFKREISSRGRFTWIKFRLMAFIDQFSGFIGFPLTMKLFGLKLRMKDLEKNFSKANGAKLLLPHTEMDILAVFGKEDQYMRASDIDEELPEAQSKHIKKIIVDGANHSFENSSEQLIKILNEFINKGV